MARSNLEYEVARLLYEKHGIVTFPCRDEAADLETLSGLRIEVKRGTRGRFHARRHWDDEFPPPLDLLVDDLGRLACTLTDSQREGGFDYLVIVVGDEIRVFSWDDVFPLIHNSVTLYIPDHYIRMIQESRTTNLATIAKHENRRHKKRPPNGRSLPESCGTRQEK